ncbi:hypothetical protein D3874_13715 [Oleomonas cavernae]|uniref:Fimbrial assembly protein n=1 Tax=Oleomonas cavernae TaxID=2320859 RepID=A0A418WD40_9PROT|nr:PilN domain-containing protein [Oleomonas cavernae]RJF87947.1 hypothetical protein D3874_13715 [Oleomonas cavernae]
MDVKAILNMDMASLGQALQRGLAWWLAELRGLMPRRWRERSQGRRLFASLDGDHLAVHRRTAQGWRSVAPVPAGKLDGAVFVLPPATALVGEFDYPVPSEAELYRMVALDLDRLTPFRADEVVFDVEVLGEAPAKGVMRHIAVAVVRRTVLAQILAKLHGLGFRPTAIGLAADDGRLRFDFARRLHGANPRRGGMLGRALRLAVPALLVLNLGLLILREQLAVESLREAVESQRLQVQLIERLRKRVELEEARRVDILDRRGRQSPLPVMDAVTTALPDGVWVTLLDWNGVELRLSGMASAGADLPSLLSATGRLRNVRPADGAAGGEGAFSVIATAVTTP